MSGTGVAAAAASRARQARAASSGRACSGRRPANPSSTLCQKPIAASPPRQHSQTWRPETSAGKSTSPVADVAEHDVPLVQPGDVGLHLVHDPAHPQPEAAQLRIGVRVVALGQLVDHLAEDHALTVAVRVAQPDQLVALLAEAAGDDGQVRDQRVGGVERVEAGHRGIVPRDRAGPVRAQCAVG